MPYIDSHCHLNYPDFKDDQANVIQRAWDAGVSHMLTICTRMSEVADVISIAEAHENIFASVGVHPHDADTHDLATLYNLMDKHIHSPKVVGIGETGLDYFYENSSREQQIKSFELHLDLAQSRGLPVIVHTRDADDDTLAVLKNFPKVRGVIHCFTGTRRLAEETLAMGFYISLSGIITFNKAEDIRATVQEVPLDHLLIETDSPFLAPVPHRGKRNEPSYVSEVAKKLSYIKQISLEEVAEATTRNFFNLFTKANA